MSINPNVSNTLILLPLVHLTQICIISGKNYLVEDIINTILYILFKKETGCLYQGLDTKQCTRLIADHLLSSVDDCINNGLSEQWKSLAKLKLLNLDQNKFLENGMTYTEFRQAVIQSVAIHNKYKDVCDDTKIKEKKQVLNKLFNEKCILGLTADKLRSHANRTNKLLKDLTDAEIDRAFNISTILNAGKEVDTLIVLPNLKLIMQVEVKNCSNVGANMSKAMTQLHDMFNYIQTSHSDMFDDEWVYCCAAALPGLSKEKFTDYCNECKNFIIFKDLMSEGRKIMCVRRLYFMYSNSCICNMI